MEGIRSMVAWELVEAVLEHLAAARPQQLLRMYQEGSLVKFLLDQQQRCGKAERALLDQGMPPWQARETAVNQLLDPVEADPASRPLGSKMLSQIRSETLTKLERWNNRKLHGTSETTA